MLLMGPYCKMFLYELHYTCCIVNAEVQIHHVTYIARRHLRECLGHPVLLLLAVPLYMCTAGWLQLYLKCN